MIYIKVVGERTYKDKRYTMDADCAELLIYLYENKNTCYSIHGLSAKLNMPLSVAEYCLKKLCGLELIQCGTDNEGTWYYCKGLEEIKFE